ncbi:MAG TPA: GxxExxY protein [Ardenticatenaceae bacterium]|nr:GxxExxY protein [Ardenticatenaceae bacterium]
MAEYDEWQSDDTTEMVAQMRAILADPGRTSEEKLKALITLAHLADDEALDVLRWYRERADPGMEFYAELALSEAEFFAEEPDEDGWDEELVDAVLRVADAVHAELGSEQGRADYRVALARGLRRESVRADEGPRALIKYGGQAIEIAALDLIVEGSLLVGIWTRDDEAKRLDASVGGDSYEPADRFYADLRASNLPWGLLVDMSGTLVSWDVVQNVDVDHGSPKVEYILALGSPAKGIKS